MGDQERRCLLLCKVGAESGRSALHSAQLKLQKQSEVIFPLGLAEIGSVLTKKFSVVRHFFPGLLARGKDLKVFCLFVLPVPIGSSRLGTSRALCAGYMKA